MRTIKLIILGMILLAIVVLSLANRELVTLSLLPEGLAGILPVSIDLPLFVVSLISILVGMVLGYILEWLREHRHRRRAAEKAREAEKLSREVDNLRKQTGKGQDDVLALLN